MGNLHFRRLRDEDFFVFARFAFFAGIRHPTSLEHRFLLLALLFRGSGIRKPEGAIFASVIESRCSEDFLLNEVRELGSSSIRLARKRDVALTVRKLLA
jgi:hypothetical protein